MTDYLLSIHQPDGVTPPPEQLAIVMQRMHAYVAEAKAARVWLFNGGLHAPSSASVVRARRGEAVVTDGPYIEGKEHLGGFLVLRCADLDAALDWAGKLAKALTLPGQAESLPVEVRPFAHADVAG